MSARRVRGPEGSPAVFAADEQSDHPVDLASLADLTEKVLHHMGVTGAVEVNLLVVNEDQISDLNRSFLDGEGPTDVLAFPIDDGEVPEPGRMPDNGDSGPHRSDTDRRDMPVLLGDIVVCPAVAAINAPTHAGTLVDELALLVVHGTLHLLGHDHGGPAETAAMQATEREILERFHQFDTPDGRPPGTTWSAETST